MNNNYFFDRKLYTVDGKSTMEINFNTMPNYFRVVNMGTADLYFSVNGVPTVNRFDMKITAGNGRLHAEPKGKMKAWIYNDSMQPTTFALLTFVEDFDPMVLAYASSESSGGSASGGGGGTFDGIIRGFNIALPSGANTIGKVDLNVNGQLGDIINALKSAIPSGANTIGKVDLNQNTQLASILEKLSSLGTVYGKFSSGNVGSSGTTITAGDNMKICRIAFLSNDSENDMSIVMDGTTMPIKAGEVLDNFDVYTDSIQLLDGGAYRMAYNVKGV